MAEDNDLITARLDAQEVRILTAIGKVETEVKHVKDTVMETAIAVARLDERVGAQAQRLGTVEANVETLRRSDRFIGALGAVIGPAVAGLIAWVTGERR